VFIEFIDIYLC